MHWLHTIFISLAKEAWGNFLSTPKNTNKVGIQWVSDKCMNFYRLHFVFVTEKNALMGNLRNLLQQY